MNNPATEKNKSSAKDLVPKPKEALIQTLAIGKKSVEENQQQIALKENEEPLPETVNSVLDAYKKRIELYKSLNAQLVDSIKETVGTTMKPVDLEKTLQLVKDNFEVYLNVMNSGMKSIIETYSKHINLTLDVNEQFSDTINNQLQLFKNMHQHSASFYSSLTRKWWKENSRKQIG
jgi:hypothetical protein